MGTEYVQEYFQQDQLAQTLGIEIVSFSAGCATARMTVQQKHLNSVRMVHGGALFALADVAFAVACNSHGTLAIAIHASMSFNKAVRSGTLTATARELSINPKLSTYAIEITDDSGSLVASFEGMAYRKKSTLQEVLAEACPSASEMKKE